MAPTETLKVPSLYRDSRPWLNLAIKGKNAVFSVK